MAKIGLTRLAVLQTKPRRGAVAENRDRALARMAEGPADVYVLPELAFTGYHFDRPEDMAALAEPAADGPSGRAMANFCQKKKAWAVFGFAESSGGRVFNAAALWGPTGLVGVYRKIHLFGREKTLFSPGDGPFPVWSLPPGRMGLMICFDWFFPESMRALALAGAQIVLHPANLVLPHCPQAMITRCLENRVFAATADRVGEETGGTGSLRFIGQSQIVSPRGDLLHRLGAEEGEAVVDVRPAEADDKRLSSGNDLFAERRPEFYPRG